MSGGGCASCASGPGVVNFQRLGLGGGADDVLVALAGSPNTGKSTVFNALTGLRQHVGNWPGSTVVRAEGSFRYGGKRHRVVDLPGTYSLRSSSADEHTARDFLLFGDPDVTVVVVDATRLERNLTLVLQILQITDRVVVALNLMDEADRHGLRFDVRHLARTLKVPVVPMSARKREGVAALLEEVANTAAASPPNRLRPIGLAPDVARAVQEIAGHLSSAYPHLRNTPWLALRLLEGDPSVVDALREGRLGQLETAAIVRRAS